MRKRIYSVVMLLSLAVPGLVSAAEEVKTEFSGNVELGIRGVDNHNDSASFQEFRTMEDSLFGQVQLDALKGAYHFQFEAEDPGKEDQSYQLHGGNYGMFKYQFEYQEMPHNYTFDAITPATGIGSSYIQFPATVPAPPPAAWNTFDYSVEHKRYGGEVEVSLKSPFYVNVGADKQEQDGLRPYSVRLPAEVPEPIANTTDNLHLQGGYLGDSLTASVSGSLSSFTNDHKYMLWDFPGGGSTDLTVFSPDNDYSKLGADLSWRGLPLGSVLALAGSHSHLENSYNANDVGFNTANPTIIPAAYLPFNRLNFKGDIDYTSLSAAITSRPMDKLDTKLYYRYLDRDDQSSIISYTMIPGILEASNAGGLLSYQKNAAGIDVGYRLPAKNKLDAGYGRQDVDRSSRAGSLAIPIDTNKIPTDTTKDDTVYIKLKNTSLDWLAGKVGYKHVERDSGTLITPTPFYYQDQSRDEWQLGVDLSPVESVDVGLDFTYKHIDYAHAIDTMQDDNRKNVYLDLTWRACQAVTLTGFVGFEKVESDANRVSVTAGATAPDYVLGGDDDFWTYGLSGAFTASEKLTFNLSWLYQNSDGNVDFNNLAAEDVSQWDDYAKHQLEAKAIYAFDAKVKMTAGYLYEKLDYQDLSYANYPALGTTYYSGLYADPNYEANVGYLALAYGF